MTPGAGGNVLAAVISLIVPGCGQLCQGRVVAGFLFFLLAAFIWIATIGLFGWIVNIGAAVEAAVWNRE